MKNSFAHNTNTKWRGFISALVAFTLLVFTSSFSSSSFASVGNLSQAVYSNHVTEISATSHSQVDSPEAPQTADRDSCCEDDEVPCADDKCDIPCTVFSVSHAVLTSMNGLLHGPGTAINALDYSVKDGISGLLNAPPPRT